jgi:hypothetical protein
MGYRTNRYSIDSLTYTKLDKNGNVLISNKVYDAGLGPSIIVDPEQNIHMVYSHQSDSGWDINYLKLDTAGNIIIPPKKISPNFHNITPHMAMDSLHNLHTIWQMYDSACLIYTKMDLSGNFIIAPIRVVYSPPASHPMDIRITTDRSNRVHLAWMDQRLGSEDIYYKRGENNQSIGEAGIKHPTVPDLCCSPNPFTDKLKINYSKILNNGKPRITIYNCLGRRVKELSSNKSSGFITWDGLDDNGIKLPTGVYLIRYGKEKTFVTEKVIKCKN